MNCKSGRATTVHLWLHKRAARMLHQSVNRNHVGRWIRCNPWGGSNTEPHRTRKLRQRRGMSRGKALTLNNAQPSASGILREPAGRYLEATASCSLQKGYQHKQKHPPWSNTHSEGSEHQPSASPGGKTPSKLQADARIPPCVGCGMKGPNPADRGPPHSSHHGAPNPNRLKTLPSKH